MSAIPPQFPAGNRGWTPALAHRLEAPVCDLEEDYRARLDFPAARHRLVLGLGGIAVGVRTDSDGIADFLLDHYGCFSETREPVVQLALGDVPVPAFPFRTLVATLMTYARGGDVVGKVREMAGYIDTAAGEGRCLVAGNNYRQDIGNYLRFVIDAMTPPLGAVLFHTAAIVRRGRAYLFFGPSTAGKSTITALAAVRHEVMTDDMLVLRREGRTIRAATCGFWGGETREYPTKRIDLPVAGLFRLRKGRDNRLDPIAPALAAVELLCGVPSLQRPRADRQFLVDFAAAAAATVPCFELTFHKNDDSFWSCIDERID